MRAGLATGVIGLGAMGSAMAANLAAAGHLKTVWNRTTTTADTVAAALDVAVADDPADLARRVDLVITCVSRDSDLQAVVDAMAPGLGEGQVVVDTSTVAAATARRIYGQLAPLGADFLDAPVSGGVEGARAGTLAMMVGGDRQVLMRVAPTLAAIARRVVYMGPAGSGQATKAVNQIMAAGINQAVCEALAFGQTMGLPMERVIDVVSQGAAGNWFLEHRGKTMVAGSYAPGFRLELHHKDLQIGQAMAGDAGGPPLPLTDATVADYEALMERDCGGEDISALYRLKRPGMGRRG
ncbi:MAG: NAD(P)-dependent oxidoreductase [Gammaproteobacteria bacterium]|nr:NAD(P)-dependent oxidoreductase [Gammaproteobacteria bacterium]